MKVLGIDPGTAVVGYGVVEDGRTTPRLVECGVIRTGARESLAARLRTINEGVTELIARHQPDVVSIEGIFYSKSVKNVRTTMVLGHARGVILLSAQCAGVTIAEYPPAMVKKTVVGRGAAVKAQVGYMCAQLLRLKSPPTPSDAADGVALALTHLIRSRLSRLNGNPAPR
jgi:crossover junction endodeoxyribonuclease RuvC